MKQRPNPGYRGPRSGKRPKRPRRGPRQSTITVYQIHCKACTKRYELAYAGEVKFCIYCASEKIEKSVRTRAETNAEREQRKADLNVQFLNMIGSVINGLFGSFAPHPGFVAPRNGNSKPSSELEAELLKEGYRKLATKYHPDKGGDPEKMKELNRLKEKLGL
jgi:hypothetical protein